MSMLHYQACGAAGTVTGSMHVFTYEYEQKTFRFAIDAGMFQTGEMMTEVMLNKNLIIDPKTIDAWILTHAHLDHTGRLAYVVKRGFKGPIYTTAQTKELAFIVMSDAVTQMSHTAERIENDEYTQIQEGKLPQHIYERKEIQLYTDSDVANTVSLFETKQVGKPFLIHPNLQVEFFEASHILGSIYLSITELSTKKTVMCSADLGFSPKPFLPKINHQKPIENLTTVLLESTYGDRIHTSVDPYKQLTTEIAKTLNKGGQIIIPSFAIQRSQEILYYCTQLMDKGAIPAVEIYLDSPMAIEAAEVYQSYSEQARQTMGHKRVHQLVSSEQSKELNSITDPCIIVAGSGMMNGGRIWQHLRFHGGKSKNKLLIVGFQAEHTHGRKVLEGERTFVIDGKTIDLKLEVVKIDGFSGHADQKMLLSWLTNSIPQSVYRQKKSVEVFLVHGEDEARSSLQQAILAKLQSSTVATFIPVQGQQFTLWKD